MRLLIVFSLLLACVQGVHSAEPTAWTFDRPAASSAKPDTSARAKAALALAWVVTERIDPFAESQARIPDAVKKHVAARRAAASCPGGCGGNCAGECKGCVCAIAWKATCPGGCGGERGTCGSYACPVNGGAGPYLCPCQEAARAKAAPVYADAPVYLPQYQPLRMMPALAGSMNCSGGR